MCACAQTRNIVRNRRVSRFSPCFSGGTEPGPVVSRQSQTKVSLCPQPLVACLASEADPAVTLLSLSSFFSPMKQLPMKMKVHVGISTFLICILEIRSLVWEDSCQSPLTLGWLRTGEHPELLIFYEKMVLRVLMHISLNIIPSLFVIGCVDLVRTYRTKKGPCRGTIGPEKW